MKRRREKWEVTRGSSPQDHTQEVLVGRRTDSQREDVWGTEPGVEETDWGTLEGESGRRLTGTPWRGRLGGPKVTH